MSSPLLAIGRDLSSYTGQQRALLTMPMNQTLYSTTVTTGLIAAVIPLDPTSINSFAGRFESTFDEMRLLRAVVRIRPLTISSGVTKFWFDEKDSSTPTNLQALERYTKDLPNTNANAKAVTTMVWTARDLLDLEFIPIATSRPPVYFKLYTDVTAFGAPATVVQLWLIEPMLTIEFRGLKSA